MPRRAQRKPVCTAASIPPGSGWFGDILPATLFSHLNIQRGGRLDTEILFGKFALACADSRRVRADTDAANECCLCLHGRTELQGLFVQRRHGRLRLSEL